MSRPATGKQSTTGPRRDPNAPLTDEVRAQIVAAYESGLNSRQVADQFNVSKTTVTNLARKRKVTVRSNRQSAKTTPKQRVRMAREYDAGATTAALAAKYGIAESSVTKIVTRAGIPMRTRGTRLEETDRADVAAEYAAGYDSPDIADRWGISKQTVLAIADDAGIPARTVANLLTDDDRAEIVTAYAAGESGVDIGAQYGISKQTVFEIVRAAGGTVRRQGTRPTSTVNMQGPLTDKDRAKIVADYAAGGTGKTVGEKWGISPQTVAVIVRAAGGTVRPRGGSKPRT